MAEALPLEDLVTCAVCQEIYHEPLALRCLHTLCAGCMETMKKRSLVANCIQCPMCRELSDTRQVKHDFRIQHLVDIYQSQLKLRREISVEISETTCCELCRKRSFTAKCMDCNKMICDGCQATHNSIPMCEGHTVVALPDILSDCSVQIGHINEALLQDRNSIVAKLHVLVRYLDELEKVKQDAILSLDNSEECFMRKVKEYYVSLREALENSVNKHRAKAESAKSTILETIAKVMERSQVIVDAFSGADVGVVLTKMDELQNEKQPLDTENKLVLPQLELELIHGPQWESFDLSRVAKLKSRSSVKADHDDDQFADISLFEIVQGASNLLEDTEKSSVHYKFKYCDQVCVMLTMLQQNLGDHAGNSSELGALGKAQCMVSPSLLNISRTNGNCNDIVNLALKQSLCGCREMLLPKCEEPQSLQIVGTKIWCVYPNSVMIYDHKLQFINKLNHKVLGGSCNMKTMIQTDDGHYLQVFESGLRILRPSRAVICVLHYGTVSEVIAEGQQVFALEKDAGEILIFKFHNVEHLGPRESPWKFERSIKSQCALSIDDTMAFVNDIIVVCSYRNDAIYRYSLDGTLLTTNHSSPSRKGPGNLWRPRICCKASDGSLIIADHYHNRLQLLSPAAEWRVLQFEQDLNFPWDAVLANDCGLVVLERCNWKHKLIQYLLPDDQA